MRGRSPSPELWKGVGAFFLYLFDKVTLGLGRRSNSVFNEILFIEIEKN